MSGKPQELINEEIVLFYEGMKERFLFNNALVTFYMALDIWKKTTRATTLCYYFRLAAMVLLYAPSQDRISYTKAFIPVVEHWLQPYIVQWTH